MYEGDRLNDLVESISEHGVLTPTITVLTSVSPWWAGKFAVKLVDAAKAVIERDQVCVWTEGDSTGKNYSSPYNQAGVETKSISYTTQPKVVKMFVLNLYNQVDMAISVKVTGSWTPN